MGTVDRQKSKASLSIVGVCTLLVPLLFGACVTVNLGSKDRKKAELAEFTAPSAEFQEYKTADADHAWQNPKNGSTISYQSACNEQADPTLETMQRSILQGLEASQITKENRSLFSGREALDTIAHGTVDGVPVTIRFLVFKKNNCNYTLNFVALSKSFDSDVHAFETFLKGFRAP